MTHNNIYIFFQSQNFSLKINDTKSYNITHDDIYIFSITKFFVEN